MEAILDTILDFGPLVREEKNGTLIFCKAYDLSKSSEYFFTKQNTRIYLSCQMSLH